MYSGTALLWGTIGTAENVLTCEGVLISGAVLCTTMSNWDPRQCPDYRDVLISRMSL